MLTRAGFHLWGGGETYGCTIVLQTSSGYVVGSGVLLLSKDRVNTLRNNTRGWEGDVLMVYLFIFQMSMTPNIAIDKGGSFLYNYNTTVAILKGGNQPPRGTGGGGGGGQIP